ncbi:hypothetical protein HAHE_17290 [Haloferula helveola]|uniref:PEP-CTERM protein-sorting domain-containing protein n=1 Tax=Haloferula helveola TaxID=490095 RepID=A0ABN6H2I3_9BACT|nr:hypothetical protein HAHE_17290 [Haloferula helveola]
MLPIAILAAAMPASRAATIFSDNFDGDGSDLDGATPDVTTGVNWVASANFNRNGTTGDGPGSATLAFTPANGFTYTLDATYGGLSANSGDTDWFAVGFVNGQSSASGTNERFITGNVVGSAWMMARGDFNLTTNNTFLGTGQLGSGNYGLGEGGGDNTGQSWSLSPPESTVDLRIVLDTTGGTGNWTATWYAKRPSDGSYTLVRSTESLLTGATITAVGLARSNPGVSGTVESFSLVSAVPEPSTVLLLALAGIPLLRRRR